MRALSLAVAASLALGFTAAPQMAAAAPDGSYRDSCRDQHTDGPILTATCRAPWGGWQTSSIDYRRCGGDIANVGGRLVCRGRDDGWRGDDRGDWRDGDRGGDWRDGDRGDWRDGDRGDDRGDWRGDDWRGHDWRGNDWRGGRGGLTLYSRTGFGGQRFGVGREAWNLNDTGFNDRAESVQIDGGEWQLCEDSGFRGRCITLSRSTPDLWRFGMGDRISSVRRIR
jgi:hypothetical protein